ncbi:hypothetical protein BU16DRAFT_3985 [Lophium mytilinum]|uniref:Uncharacterized protein n=1 Tax=Lophium mytilinum TaxID=390894 RepID=A0A6A6RCV3_9PEZI|nr:hypothetical protein BU16DRAFT_3985 [Lophium mytilinum]
MSMDAGGLAQMTYNNFQPNGGLGLPGAGFASRGKGSQLKRLSVASPPTISSISEHQVENPTPRTSRGHLLANLRKEPRTPSSIPASAPYNQQRFGGMDLSRYSGQAYGGVNQGGPQTAVGSSFSSAGRNQYGQNQQIFSPTEQVLAPPPVQFDSEQMDPDVVAQLMATEMYLQQRQQQLQQQLLSLTAQQFQGMNIGSAGMRQSQQYPATPYTPGNNFYSQQMSMNTQQPLETGQPGVYLVINPMTGQYNYVVDPAYQQAQQNGGNMQQQLANLLASSPPPPTPSYTNSPPKSNTPTFRAEVSPPAEMNSNPFDHRSSSPPKKSPSPPQDVVPLPPPSANAFRRGHKKMVSSLALSTNSSDLPSDGPRSAFTPRTAFPNTPMTGTFGPGQSRAGEHPVRQPRGPPPLEELQASPTTKHEGSKNFATRQRRRAVHSLVRAGIERRGVRTGSGGSMTPVSESDMGFSLSDNDSDSVHSGGSGSLSGKPSIGSLRAAANGAIGSERKELKERSRDRTSVDGRYTANSVSSDEGSIGGGLVEICVEDVKPVPEERRKMPMLVLTSAEKRKSSMY